MAGSLGRTILPLRVIGVSYGTVLAFLSEFVRAHPDDADALLLEATFWASVESPPGSSGELERAGSRLMDDLAHEPILGKPWQEWLRSSEGRSALASELAIAFEPLAPPPVVHAPSPSSPAPDPVQLDQSLRHLVLYERVAQDRVRAILGRPADEYIDISPPVFLQPALEILCEMMATAGVRATERDVLAYVDSRAELVKNLVERCWLRVLVACMDAEEKIATDPRAYGRAAYEDYDDMYTPLERSMLTSLVGARDLPPGAALVQIESLFTDKPRAVKAWQRWLAKYKSVLDEAVLDVMRHLREEFRVSEAFRVSAVIACAMCGSSRAKMVATEPVRSVPDLRFCNSACQDEFRSILVASAL
jgi:hypothetical protein